MAVWTSQAWRRRNGGPGSAPARRHLGDGPVGRAAWHRPCITERWRHTSIMKLLPLDTPERIELVAGWLGKPENYKWLDFGNGVQRVTPITLKIMSQRDLHVFRIYTAGDEDAPAGVVGLTNVDRNFKTASLWAVLGRKRYGGGTASGGDAVITPRCSYPRHVAGEPVRGRAYTALRPATARR